MITAEDLKRVVNDVEIVGRYVDLKRSGARYVGKCPFRAEKSPSFVVYPVGRGFHCFGCGQGGDIITFIELIEGLDFRGAFRFLARDAGIPINEWFPHFDRGLAAKLSSAESRGFDLWLHLLRRHLLARQSRLQDDLAVFKEMLDEFGIQNLPDKIGVRRVQDRMTMLHECCALIDERLDDLSLRPERHVETFLRRLYGDDEMKEALEV